MNAYAARGIALVLMAALVILTWGHGVPWLTRAAEKIRVVSVSPPDLGGILIFHPRLVVSLPLLLPPTLRGLVV